MPQAPDPTRPLPSFDAATLAAANEKMMVTSLITPDHLYLDLGLLRDLRLGAAMSLMLERQPPDAKARYAAVMRGLKAYSERVFYDVPHYFPELGVTDAQIDARLAERKQAGAVFFAAPTTEFLGVLGANLKLNANHSAVIGKRDDVRVVVNTWPLDLADFPKLQNLTGQMLARSFGVVVSFVRLDPRTAPAEFLLQFDEVYTLYFNEFMHSPTVRAAFSNTEFLTKHVFMARQLNTGVRDDLDTSLELTMVQERMNMLSTLTYIPIARMSPPVPDEAPAGAGG